MLQDKSITLGNMIYTECNIDITLSAVLLLVNQMCMHVCMHVSYNVVYIKYIYYVKSNNYTLHSLYFLE